MLYTDANHPTRLCLTAVIQRPRCHPAKGIFKLHCYLTGPWLCVQSVIDGSIVITALTGLTTLGCLSFPPVQVMVMEVTDMICAGRHPTHSSC